MTLQCNTPARGLANRSMRADHRQWLISLVLALLLRAVVVAQETPPRPVGKQETMKSDPTGKRLAEDFLESLPVKVFILPDDLGRLSSRLSEWGSVSIPMSKLEEYLRRRMAEMERPQWTLTGFELTGTLEERRARLDASITLRVDRAGSATVNLGMNQAHCESALDSQGQWPAVFKDGEDGPYRVTVDQPGTYKYLLQLWMDISRSAGERQLKLTLPDAAVKSVRLSASEPVLFARHGQSGRSFDLEPDQKSIRPTLRAGESLDLVWRTVRDRSDRLTSVTANGLLSYHLHERSLETQAELTVNAQEAALEWLFRLPPREQIEAVHVEQAQQALKCETSVAGLADATELRVRLAEPVSGLVQVRIETKRDVPVRDPLVLGRFELQSAATQEGTVLLFVDPELRALPKPSRRIRRIALAELEAGLQRREPIWAFRYFRQPAELEVQVQKASPVVRATARSEIRVAVDRAKIRTTMEYTISQSLPEELRLRVPADMVDIDVVSAGEVEISDIRPDEPSGSQEVIIALLGGSASRKLTFTLEGSTPVILDRPNLIALPGPDFDCTGVVLVSAEPNVALHLDRQRTVGLQQTPVDAPAETTGRPANGSAEPLWRFRRQAGPASLAFSAQRRPQQIAVAVEADIRQTSAGLRVESLLGFRAENEPLEQIVLRVPDGLRELKIGAGGQTVAAISDAGMATIPLTSPAYQSQIRVEYTFPTAESAGGAVRLPLVLPNPNKADVGSFKARIWCEPGQRAVLSAPWKSGPPPPKETVGPVPTTVVGQDAPAETLDMVFEPTASLASLVVPRMAIEEMLFANGMRRGRKRMLVTVHRTRTALVRVPEQCRLLGVWVDGSAVPQTDFDGRICRVALPAEDRPCSLELDYEVYAPHTLGATNRISMESPLLADNPEIGAVQWVVSTDPDWLLYRWSADGHSDVTWRFHGLLSSPVSRITAGEVRDWLMEPAAAVSWRPAVAGEAGRRVWGFSTWTDETKLVLYCVREPFWVLVCSGGILVLGLAVSRARSGVQTRVGVAGAVVAAAMLWTVPDTAAWCWYGGQWGVILAVLAVVARALAIRRRRWRLRERLSPVQVRPGSSLVKRLQPEPAAALRE